MGKDSEIESLRQSLNRLLKEAFTERQGAFQEPFIYGFTVRSTDARPDVPQRMRVATPEEKAREVCAEIVEAEGQLFVTMEIPEQPEAPRVSAKGRRLIVTGKGAPLGVDLPDDVEADPVSVSARNGVLDVVLQRSQARPALRIN